MAKINDTRMTALIEGDFVVFLIGMRINKPWKLHKWLPVFFGMPRMLKELQRDPASGFNSSLAPLAPIYSDPLKVPELGEARLPPNTLSTTSPFLTRFTIQE